MEKVLVVDFGSQYNQLIVRRIRELGVYSELISPDFNITAIEKMIENGELKGLVLSGGPDVITESGALRCDDKIFELDIPILGICYGMQFMANYYGNNVVKSDIKEYGIGQILIDENSLIVQGLNDTEKVWMSHGYHVELINDNLKLLSKSNNEITAIIEHKSKKQYGLQFHPEVTHTENGNKILENFLDVCEVSKTWTMDNYIAELKTQISNQVKKDEVILALSGGVDSTVVAALLAETIPNQVTCIIVDHGLLRENEITEIVELLKPLPLNLKVVDAQDLFLKELATITDPEQKRKIIGKLFIDVFDSEKQKLKSAKFLAQGTLYTDIIESGTHNAQTIKSHHNVGGLPEEMDFELIEPLKWLFKDEVRKLGLSLKLPENVVYRQPFPGPGLAIRIIGDITKEKLRILRKADYIFREEIKNYNLDRDIWQYFAVLTNIQTVGVKGDERSYEYVLALRGVASIDGMSADYYPIPYEILSVISSRITNEVRGINRVVYDITSKPPATIEWE